jgi:hypothetical protein
MTTKPILQKVFKEILHTEKYNKYKQEKTRKNKVQWTNRLAMRIIKKASITRTTK